MLERLVRGSWGETELQPTDKMKIKLTVNVNGQFGELFLRESNVAQK